jgi:hypothetical protein
MVRNNWVSTMISRRWLALVVHAPRWTCSCQGQSTTRGKHARLRGTLGRDSAQVRSKSADARVRRTSLLLPPRNEVTAMTQARRAHTAAALLPVKDSFLKEALCVRSSNPASVREGCGELEGSVEASEGIDPPPGTNSAGAVVAAPGRYPEGARPPRSPAEVTTLGTAVSIQRASTASVSQLYHQSLLPHG